MSEYNQCNITTKINHDTENYLEMTVWLDIKEWNVKEGDLISLKEYKKIIWKINRIYRNGETLDKNKFDKCWKVGGITERMRQNE